MRRKVRIYRDEAGRDVYVAPYINKTGGWAVVRRSNANESHVVASPLLPITRRFDEAQWNLDRFAAVKGWKEVD